MTRLPRGRFPGIFRLPEGAALPTGNRPFISGFTFVRDAVRLDYPVGEAIRSILPIVDEFVVNLGDCSDDTEKVILALGDPKVRIIHTPWNPDRFVRGATNADQTNIALDHCRGEWCFYLQADEVVHEQDHHRILETVRRCRNRPEVDGILFSYNHFWGDYSRVQRSHCWYRHDIRLIRAGRGIRSWKSAQSFRKDDGASKLSVVDSGAWIYHYGWVRHPMVMRRKQKALDSLHHSGDWVEKRYGSGEVPWDYGPLEKVPLFRGTHPAVMEERIRNKDWRAEDFRNPDSPPKHEHLKLSMRIHTALEHLLGIGIGEYRNWKLLRN